MDTTPLQSSMIVSWARSDMSKAELKSVKDLCSNLSRLINRSFGNPADDEQDGRFVVDVFGSVAWGGQTGSSGDLDLVVRVSTEALRREDYIAYT